MKGPNVPFLRPPFTPHSLTHTHTQTLAAELLGKAYKYMHGNVVADIMALAAGCLSCAHCTTATLAPSPSRLPSALSVCVCVLYARCCRR